MLDIQNYNGYNLRQNIDIIIRYNAEQLYKQVLIDIQQQKKLEIENTEFQRILKQQNNQRLCLNENKISGFIDTQAIGLNNLAKVEGIKKEDNNAKVKFVTVIDGNETKMCNSLDKQEFYINKENIFNRYYGETQKELRIERVKCKGLVVGLNLPPITHHFHWCRSYIIYLKQEEVKESNFEIKENIINETIKILNNKELNKINRTALLKNISRMQKISKDFPILKNTNIQYKVINEDNGSAMFAQPTRNKYLLGINQKVFNQHIKEYYNKGTKVNDNPQGTTYKDIATHEAGHIISFEIIKKVNNGNLEAMQFDYDNNITTNNIVEKAFDNLKIYDNIEKEKHIRNISNYACQDSSETIGEAFADYYANKEKANILSKEIVKTMKGMM